jgi:addiction module HigA family antidote
MNAVCRRALHVGKQTVLNWEKRFAELHDVLLMYALTHVFLHPVIEGDEAYTKVGKNVPPEDSQGWTIMLLDRAGRFIWEMRCGTKDRKLFLRAIKRLCKLIESNETSAMVMKNSPHPRLSIKESCIEPLGLTVTHAAKHLGVARHTLSRVINGQAGISPDMAIRLEKASWSNADFWMRLQAQYDLAQARQHTHTIKVGRFVTSH